METQNYTCRKSRGRDDLRGPPPCEIFREAGHRVQGIHNPLDLHARNFKLRVNLLTPVYLRFPVNRLANHHLTVDLLAPVHHQFPANQQLQVNLLAVVNHPLVNQPLVNHPSPANLQPQVNLLVPRLSRNNDLGFPLRPKQVVAMIPTRRTMPLSLPVVDLALLVAVKLLLQNLRLRSLRLR